MLFINLDDPGVNAEFMTFAGGEPYAKVPLIIGEETVLVKACVRQPDDMWRLITLLDCLYHQDKKVLLFMPYFPGARQDRVSDPETPAGTVPFSADITCRLLARYVTELITFDIHSENARTIINMHFKKARFINSFELPRQYLPSAVDYVVAPDKGAIDRATKFRDQHYKLAKLICCTKERDAKTGHLSHYEIPTFATNFSGRFLVVDDICDGGGTFNLFADAWEKTCDWEHSELFLFVSHGIFSKGIETLSPMYERIYTTDSWCCLVPEVQPQRLNLIHLTNFIQEILNKEHAHVGA